MDGLIGVGEFGLIRATSGFLAPVEETREGFRDRTLDTTLPVVQGHWS